MSGPLQGLRVLELAGLGPAPLAAMLLADLGADVVRIDRPQGASIGLPSASRFALMQRGKRLVMLDLKQAEAREQVLQMVQGADVLIEGFRPGVVERLGLGPSDCQARNPRLVYGRVTGWGREGPLADVAGHDINYIALSGALAAIGGRERPAIPLNLLGDFGGGALYLVFGILAALFERQGSGRGQVVDAAMVDGVAALMTTFFAQQAAGTLRPEREANLVDGGAPFYALYTTADGEWISIGAIEPKFFQALADAIGLAPDWVPRQYERAAWPALRAAIAERFATRTRAQWCARLEPLDVCFAPVLDLAASPHHAHHAARATYVEVDGVVQPAPGPRFDRTPAPPAAAVPTRPTPAGQVIQDWTGPAPPRRPS